MSNHYIRVDVINNIIKGFSDAFETPLETDILISSGMGSQFQLPFSDGSYSEGNPPMSTNQIYLYRYVDGVIIPKTVEEVAVEKSLIAPIVIPPTHTELEMIQLKTRVKLAEDNAIALMDTIMMMGF